jgi:adhesin/invasin
MVDITVTATDPYGNVVTSYTGTVRFSSSDPKAVLPADYTFTAADAGVHTFRGLKLFTKGKQTITVTDVRKGSILGNWTVDVD